MLQKIHDQAQSWIAWVIVGLLIVPFALWGINSYFEGGNGAIVAEVNGTEITLRDYQRSLQQQRQRMRSMLGNAYSPELLENPQMRRAVLDGMVENELVTQTINSDGFRVSDAVLFAQLRQISAFQHDGAFSPAIYEQVLASQGMSKPFFENSLRTDIMQSQLLTAFRSGAYVMENELREAVRLQEQQRTVRLLTIPASVERLDSREVSDEEVSTQYDMNARRYEIPEQLSIEYVELSVAQFAEGVTADEEEIKKLYEERKESLMADEERHARHILIEVAEDADEATQAKADGRLKEVQSKLAAGESFESLAEQYSDDPGSAMAGGDLGFFPRGIMVPAFDEAVFSMQQGALSDPIRTQFGYHLIRLEEIQAAEMRSYEDARDELAADLKRQKGEELFYEHSETVSNIAYEEPDSLEGAAAAAGLQVEQSGTFSRQGSVSGITSKPTVVQAAFSDLVLNEGKNSDPIELADDHIVILRLNEHQPASRKPLESVRAEVVDAVLAERAQSHARTQGMDLLQKLQQQQLDADGAAAEAAATWGEQQQIKRKSFSIAEAAVSRAFQMKSKAEGVSYGGIALNNGDYVVVELIAVADGDLNTLEAGRKDAIRRGLVENQMQSHYQSYLASLRNSADIQVYEDQLN